MTWWCTKISISLKKYFSIFVYIHHQLGLARIWKIYLECKINFVVPESSLVTNGIIKKEGQLLKPNADYARQIHQFLDQTKRFV